MQFNGIVYGLFLLMLLIFAGCGKSDVKSSLVTERIQYDVTIKSPDPEYDWWVQNLEGAKREGLLADIFGSVSGGKVKAYDFFSNKLLTPDEVKKILRRTDTVAVERPDPPHELVDTVLVHELSMKEISRLRFLEEWQMDHQTLAFTKKVVGICPLVEVYAESGELRGYKPLFWVFFDERYPGILK